MEQDAVLDITPRMYAALREAAREKRRLEAEIPELLLGQLIEVVRLTAFNQYDPPLTAGNLIAGGREFMPSEWQRKTKHAPRVRRLTRKERQRIIDSRRDYWKMVCKAGSA